MVEPEKRRWLCVDCEARLVLEEACLSGKLPDVTTICDVCGAIGKFRLMPLWKLPVRS